MLLTSVPATAQPTEPPSYQRDGEILFKETSREAFPGYADEALTCDPYASVVEYRGWNKRTVGNGVVGQTVDTRGSLIDPQTLIDNGLISATARISFWTRVQGGGPVQPMPSSHLKVNDCDVQPAVVFHFVGDDANKKVQFVAEVPANCLLYGVRSAADAEEPEPRENVIQLITATAPEVDDCKECGDKAGCHLRTSLVGDVDWLRREVPGFSTDMDESGEEEARSFEHDWSLRAEFEALAPIALVHGYADAVRFFEQHGVRDGETQASEFTAPMKERHVAYELIHTPDSVNKNKDHAPNIRPQEAALMGADILSECKKVARKFGADYVNIVSHSLGAIWTRFAVEQLAKQPESDIGILQVVTLAPAHNGSVLGDIRHTTTNPHSKELAYKLWKYPLPLRQFGNNFGPADASLPDSTTWRAREFREKHAQSLPDAFFVKGISSAVRYYTVPANYNRNRNCLIPLLGMLDRATCKDAADGHFDPENECSRYKDGEKFSREVELQVRSLTIQGSRYVLLLDGIVNRPPECEGPPRNPNEIVACLIDQDREPGFWDCKYPYNDFTLRTEGMYFEEKFQVFAEAAEQPGGSGLEPIGQDSAGRAFYYRNHSMVGDTSMARKLLERLLNTDVQLKLRAK